MPSWPIEVCWFGKRDFVKMGYKKMGCIVNHKVLSTHTFLSVGMSYTNQVLYWEILDGPKASTVCSSTSQPLPKSKLLQPFLDTEQPKNCKLGSSFVSRCQ
jgi:hypothetical protein